MAKKRYAYPFYAPPHRPAGPYLPIRLVNPIDKVSFVWNCLVDTGADSCLFTAALASLAGHNLGGDGVKSDVTAGIEGKQLVTYKHTFCAGTASSDRSGQSRVEESQEPF